MPHSCAEEPMGDGGGVGQRSKRVVWPAEAIWESVAPLLPGFSVEVLPEVDSTNTELMRRARAGRMEPTLLVAERQTAGRGRLGRHWLGDGNGTSLTFSLGLALTPNDWSGLSLAVGLSIVESLHPDLRLKWPNDVWWDDRKMAGILIETANVGGARFAVIGVGINLTLPIGQDLRQPAAALTELVSDVNAGAALSAVVLPLVHEVIAFERQGFEPMRNAYQARDVLRDREVQCSDTTVGVARGVDTTGALLVHTAAGLQKITSAEVSVRPLAGPTV